MVRRGLLCHPQNANSKRRRGLQPQTHGRSCDRQRRWRTCHACLRLAELRGQEPLRHRRGTAVVVVRFRDRDVQLIDPTTELSIHRLQTKEINEPWQTFKALMRTLSNRQTISNPSPPANMSPSSLTAK